MKFFFLRVLFFCFCGAIFALARYKISLAYDYDSYHTIKGGFQASLSFGDLRLFPRLSIKDSSDFDVKNWSLAVTPLKIWSLYVGTMYISGIFSRFSNPIFYAPDVLKNFGARQTGIIVSLPTYSSGEIKTLAAVTSLRFGSFQFHTGGRLQKEEPLKQLRNGAFPFFVAAEYSFPHNTQKWRSAATLRGSVCFLVGHTVLEPKEDSAWFGLLPFYAPTSVHYVIAEGTLKNNRFDFFTSNGFMEHPQGDLYFFTRNEISLRFWYTMLNAAFSLIDSGYIGSSGSVSRQSINAYVNPQILLPLNMEGTMKLKTGFLIALKYSQDAARRPTENFSADFKAALAFSSRHFYVVTEYRINGCNVFEKLAVSKDSIQIIFASIQYRTSASKPKLLTEISVKNESHPFFYGNNFAEVKNSWLLTLKGKFRVLPDLELTVSGDLLFKKNANEYTAACGVLYAFAITKTRSEVYAGFLFNHKASSNRTKIATEIKYTLQIR